MVLVLPTFWCASNDELFSFICWFFVELNRNSMSFTINSDKLAKLDTLSSLREESCTAVYIESIIIGMISSSITEPFIVPVYVWVSSANHSTNR